MEEPSHFDLTGPLPGPGVTVLEASAGTGKTFTIAALVARMVAEGVAPLSSVLVVTFTRLATGELRDRVRARLVSAEAGLARVTEQGEPTPPGDAVLELLSAGPPAEVSSRHARLVAALASFDAATITTTHGFCHAALSALGVWGEVADNPALLEDTTDLVEEAVDDLLVRHVLRSGAVPFRRRVAVQAGLKAVANPGTPLDPPPEPSDGSVTGLRRRLAGAVRLEVQRRLLEGNLLTYDDLLVKLAGALSDPARGPEACNRLRQRYQVVLVDEFQDTDNLQWEVVRRAFADGTTRLVLIGDPKQAVYSFRGADVYAYLQAARSAGPSSTLDQNWRSDAPLLAAYDALFYPAHLGHPEIVYRRAQATPSHRAPGLVGAPSPAPLRARLVLAGGGVMRTTRGLLQKDAAVRFIADDLVAEAVELLSSGATLVGRNAEGDQPALPRPVAAGDIGVLVRTNRQAVIVQSALRGAGVPVVVAGAESVLATPAARQWLSLLAALEHPAARSLAADVALTPFVGMSALELAGADERGWGELHGRLHDWSRLVRQAGVASLYAHISATGQLPGRLLSLSDGERRLTDLGHVAELLHAEARRSQLGLAALRTWLCRRIDEARADGPEVELRSRRLDSDAAAVQVLTVHRSKGLEFPVVYCPYLWDVGWRDQAGEPVVFHDKEERRKLDVGAPVADPVYSGHYRAAQAERRAEDLRLLYVALTRARHQAVLWWAGVKDCQHSALGRLLLARGPLGDVQSSGRAQEPRDAEVEAQLGRLASGAPGLISVERCGGPRQRCLPAAGEFPTGALRAAKFARELDQGWRRSSYTSITAASHAARPSVEPGALEVVSSEPERGGTTDEPVRATAGPDLGSGTLGGDRSIEAGRQLTAAGEGTQIPAAAYGRQPASAGAGQGATASARRGTLSAWATVPAGAEVGTLVHAVLEAVDFAATDLHAALLEAVTSQLAGYGGPAIGTNALVVALRAAVEAPLGRLAPGAALRDFPKRHRLAELTFELPLLGGEGARGAVSLTDIADLLARHLTPADPIYGYGAELDSPDLVTELRGYLTGSLDAVLRWSHDGQERYLVVDYKTNWLAGPGEELTDELYRSEALTRAMRRAHYPLQALLYLVALHRYLRYRLPGYSPGTHLGGVVYLFLRGMRPASDEDGSGPDGHGSLAAEEPTGVFSWRPPVALVTELSDMFDGDQPPAPGPPAAGPPAAGQPAPGPPAPGQHAPTLAHP